MPPVSRRQLLAAGIGVGVASVLGGCSAPATSFQATGGGIRGLDGSAFVPLGANVGTSGSFDWKGDARGHAADALAWGWNTVRLNLMVTGAQSWSYVAKTSQTALLEVVSGFVEEYTAAGIVVILDAHDDPRAKGVEQRAVENGLVSWWTAAAAAFRDNPRVWSGLINEPAYTNADWVSLMDTLAAAVRGTGNQHPVLLGAPCWGQDVGHTPPYFTDAEFGYADGMAPALARRHGNVVLEQHNYGAYGLYSTAAGLTGYLNAVRAAGLTPLIGEFGYTIDQTSTAGSFQANEDGANAVVAAAAGLGVGALWWHGTHGDQYSLKADGGPFWQGGSPAGLSPGGRQLWDLGKR